MNSTSNVSEFLRVGETSFIIEIMILFSEISVVILPCGKRGFNILPNQNRDTTLCAKNLVITMLIESQNATLLSENRLIFMFNENQFLTLFVKNRVIFLSNKNSEVETFDGEN